MSVSYRSSLIFSYNKEIDEVCVSIGIAP